jgi:predicted nucleic-acid-binding protein
LSVAASIDTNVLVRLVIKDDAQQFAVVQKVLTQYAKRLQTLLVPVTVVLEFEWVLRTHYRIGKLDFIRTLNALLASIELVFEAEDALEQSLLTYEEGSADFSDCLHIAMCQKAVALPFLTFDSKASKVEGAKLLR